MRIERPDREPDLIVRAIGEPKTAGSKTSGVAMRKDPRTGKKVPVKRNGKYVTFTKDSSGKPGKDWRGTVASAGTEAMDGAEKFDQPVYVEMTFLRERSSSHYGSGRNAGFLKASAPLYPATRPDVLKMARAVEDSLTGVVWRDDSRVVCGPNEKVFAAPNEPIGVEVRIWLMPATVGDLEAEASPQAALVIQ
jgi:Holliday junction resolvase RusA-like endonuclease